MSIYVLNFENESDIEDFCILYSQYKITINHKSIIIENINSDELSIIINDCLHMNINIISSMEKVLGV
jgi:hypothetical protein